jgi:hypothetical protein
LQQCLPQRTSSLRNARGVRVSKEAEQRSGSAMRGMSLTLVRRPSLWPIMYGHV